MADCIKKELFYKFELHPWEKDCEFQAGLSHLRAALPEQSDEEFQWNALKLQHYYYNKLLGESDGFKLESYVAWRKIFQQNVDIFKMFQEYKFERDENFQQGFSSIVDDLCTKDLTGPQFETEMLNAKLYYYSTHVHSIDKQDYKHFLKLQLAKKSETSKCPIFSNIDQRVLSSGFSATSSHPSSASRCPFLNGSLNMSK